MSNIHAFNKEIGLCAQRVIIILDSILNIIGGTCKIIQRAHNDDEDTYMSLIWVCYPSCTNCVFHILEEKWASQKKNNILRTNYLKTNTMYHYHIIGGFECTRVVQVLEMHGYYSS